MKFWIVYQGPPRFYHAMLVREDGRIMAEHCCSEPGYMLGDLYRHRPDRIAQWPDAEVDPTPYQIEIFKVQFPEIFDKAFHSEPITIKVPKQEYNWKSEGPGGCDSHNIEHPCGVCITGKRKP